MTSDDVIREANQSDWPMIWTIFHDIVKAGDTYAFEPDTEEFEAKRLWLDVPQKTYVYEKNGRVLGTYYLKTNQAGPGKHICNCGYMVLASARGQGIASKMCAHSQEMAKQLGYSGMQFNFVAASNKGAVRLWQANGFDIVGRLPKAFNHPELGFVDALVMFKTLSM